MTRNVLKIRMQKSVLRGRNRRVESLGLFGRLFVSRSSTKTRLCGVPLSLIPARRFGTAGAAPTILGAKGNGSFISATQILKCQRLPFSAVRFFYRYRQRIRWGRRSFRRLGGRELSAKWNCARPLRRRLAPRPLCPFPIRFAGRFFRRWKSLRTECQAWFPRRAF